jgi:sortase A
MALYSYVKKRGKLRKKIAKIFSIVCIFSGVGILSSVIYPILTFDFFYSPKFNSLIRPLPATTIGSRVVENIPAILGATTTDYTKASVWFPKAYSYKIDISTTSYLLSIPKLGIEEANVQVGGEDLSKHLIQFTGPLPGNPGNPVIFGHSTLLFFYNPKDYKTIFSKLPDLDINDEITIILDNITYTYQVFDMKIISPDDISVLEQNYDDSYITLVTCVPPGTYFRRLIVRGKLVNI